MTLDWLHVIALVVAMPVMYYGMTFAVAAAYERRWDRVILIGGVVAFCFGLLRFLWREFPPT